MATKPKRPRCWGSPPAPCTTSLPTTGGRTKWRKSLPSSFPSLDLSRLKTYSISRRRHKAAVGSFGAVQTPSKEFIRFVGGLPKILKEEDWRKLIGFWLAAKRKKKTRLAMAGGGKSNRS